jgi:3-hydroxymyristoyl/3-hydroxydecanoyl-(acyl carrier protein) dehydratase
VSAAAPAVIERVFQPDHPASRGHFPGNPIIPGALLLSETIMAIEQRLNASLVPFQIVSAKFPHPARPGERVVIEFTRSAAGEVAFECAVDGRPVLTGRMSCRALPTAP